jgi:acyl dehydratase
MLGLEGTAVTVGDTLPVLRVPLTRSLIVSAALASRDWEPMHHDPEAAQNRGLRDVFMNIISTNGFVGRYITDWAGPDARLKRICIRLGCQNYPGDTMELTGTVMAKADVADGCEVQVDVRGANSIGDHVTGTVTVLLASFSRRTEPHPADQTQGSRQHAVGLHDR